LERCRDQISRLNDEVQAKNLRAYNDFKIINDTNSSLEHMHKKLVTEAQEHEDVRLQTVEQLDIADATIMAMIIAMCGMALGRDAPEDSASESDCSASQSDSEESDGDLYST